MEPFQAESRLGDEKEPQKVTSSYSEIHCPLLSFKPSRPVGSPSNQFEKSFERAFDRVGKTTSIANILCYESGEMVKEKSFLPVPPGMSTIPFLQSSYPHDSQTLSSLSGFAVPCNFFKLQHQSCGPQVTPSVNSTHSEVLSSTGIDAVDGGYYYSVSQQDEGMETLERRLRSQERNRIAAMRSRQRKKKEWERLIESEHLLRQENASLRNEIDGLQEEIRKLSKRT